MPVAVADRLLGTLIAPTAEELRDLVLQRLLQDQPGSQTANHLHRVLLPIDTGQHLIQFRAEPLARGYLLHAGVPPSSTCSGSKRRLRPQPQFPRLTGRDPRRWIIREVEDSLKRLGTDWIDLYQIHRYEPGVDIEETLGALTDLVHQGKVRYVGSSVFPPSAIVEAQWIARERNLQRYVCEQPPYSMLARGIEADVLPTCQRYGMGSDPVEPALRRLAGRALAQGRR